MSKNLDNIAEYLANDLSDVNMYDVKAIKSKLLLGLHILLDDELKSELTDKLRKKTNTHIKVNQQLNIEVKFWKDSVRDLLTTKSDINNYYEKIDQLLIDKGFKTK